MGPTGSGKSSVSQINFGQYPSTYTSQFIGAATNSDIGVGHELQSCTTEINMVKLNYLDPSRITDFDIVFVDTPGFDDTNKTDVEILEMLADWLNKTWVHLC
jgi:predicted GTPase